MSGIVKRWKVGGTAAVVGIKSLALSNGRIISRDFGNWLAGFIDGEGHFGITHNKHFDTYQLRFCIKLRDDDAAIVREIRDALGIGKVRKIAARGRSRSQAMWHVEARRDLSVLLEVLSHCPLRAKKARDLVIWKRAVDLVLTTKPGGQRGIRRGAVRWRGWGQLKLLRSKLLTIRQYPGAP